MGIIHSTTIKDITKIGDNYKFSFGLYNKDTGYPFNNISGIYKKTNRFENLYFVYHIKDINGMCGDGIIHNAQLVMVANMGFDRSNLYVIIPNTNHIINKGLEIKYYDFEIFLDENQPHLCTLRIIDSRLMRRQKLEKIKQKINE